MHNFHENQRNVSLFGPIFPENHGFFPIFSTKIWQKTVNILKCHKPDFLQAIIYGYIDKYNLKNQQIENSGLWQFKIIRIQFRSTFLDILRRPFRGLRRSFQTFLNILASNIDLGLKFSPEKLFDLGNPNMKSDSA